MVVPLTSGLAAGEPGAGNPAAADAATPLLLRFLVDGQLHSGQELAQLLGISRAAVWKGIERLRLRGIQIDALPRQGYRLRQPVELLDADRIRASVAQHRWARIKSLELRFDVDSTNSRLLAASPPPYGFADVLMSELQHAGRGRRGREWVMPFGGGIALSLSWSFADTAQASPALSLCVGVAAARALARAGARGIGLKWPNDIWFSDQKLGGVLLELRAEASGPAHVVIGVGINVRLSTSARSQIEATGVRVAAAEDACASPPSRNLIAGAIIDELLSMLVEFEQKGFGAFREAWTSLDALRDRNAMVSQADHGVFGTARGVGPTGALRLENQRGDVHEYVSGEVSLRLVGDDI